jgi:hypothetical protein
LMGAPQLEIMQKDIFFRMIITLIGY